MEVAARAGLTRGALNHHYENIDALVVHSVSQRLQDTNAEIRSFAGLVQNGSLSLSGSLDHLWGIFSGPFFLVTREQVTAPRQNEVLRSQLVEVTREFHKALDEIWSIFFADVKLDDAEVRTAFNVTLCLLRGMGVQTILRTDPKYYEGLLAFWKSVLSAQQHSRPRVRGFRSI